MNLTFDSPNTCDTWISAAGLPTSGSVVRTSTNYVRSSRNLEVSSDSTAANNYLGESIGGGVSTTFQSGGRSINILGIHRIGTFVTNFTRNINIFDHSVHTPVALMVTGSQAAGNRVVSSGEIKIDHNKAKYSLDATISNLSYSANCCYPTSGTLVFNRSGSRSGNLTVAFSSSCGSVNVTDSSGSSYAYAMSACE